MHIERRVQVEVTGEFQVVLLASAKPHRAYVHSAAAPMTRLSFEDETLDVIYGAAVEPALWVDVADRFVKMTGETAGSITRLDMSTGVGLITTSSGGDPAALDPYFEYFYDKNPLQIVRSPSDYASDWRPKILLDEDILVRHAYEKSEYFNEFCRPLDAE